MSFKKTSHQKNKKIIVNNTLIVGAGEAGRQILKSISSLKNTYTPVGFIDDSPAKRGKLLQGVLVLGIIDDIPRIVKKHKIVNLIIALPSAGSGAIKKSVELGRKSGVQNIRVIPTLSEIIDGKVSFKDIREIQVEDLLGREKILLDEEAIESFIKNKKILITGAAGSIGSELSKQVLKFKPSQLILIDQDETGIFNALNNLKDKFSHVPIISFITSITDSKKMNYIFSQYSPNIVFHAAAYKHVPLMEEHPDEAVKNNIFGTKIIAEASLNAGVSKFIFISTDKAINPTSVMGATKRVGEMICQQLSKKNKTKFISVRFGNVLNSRGSVIPIFKEQIKKGGPIEVTHPDMKRYFMLISEACLLLMQASAMGQGGEVFVLDMGTPVKILDLAKEMIKLSGLVLDKDIAITFAGIRPGEKLFEEMLTAEEGTAATQHEKIFIARLSDSNIDNLEAKIKNLRLKFLTLRKDEIINALNQIIPFYKINDPAKH